MPFMLLIFGFLLGAVLWAFFHYRPRGVNRSALAVFNVATVLLAVPASIAVGVWIYSGAADMPEKQRLAAYLAVMAGGTAYLAFVSLAGLIRNFFVFPLSRRGGSPEDHQIV
jgi:hypothetical protein